MKKTIYRNGKGGYGNIVATKEFKQKTLHGAYTACALSACGLVILKGKEYHSTGRGIPAGILSAIIGASAFNYWVNTKGWLESKDGRVRAASGAINTLNARYSGTGPTFNTNRAAIQLVASCMRIGGDGGMNYIPTPYEIDG